MNIDNLNPYPGTLKFLKFETSLPYPTIVDMNKYVDKDSQIMLKEINDNLYNYIDELIKKASAKDAERINELESILERIYKSYVSTEPIAYEICLWSDVKKILKK
jgi:uncharacterized protein (UPF0305 family)